jgi:hypothetical protein
MNVAEGTLAPLLCSGCGAPLPVVDAAEEALREFERFARETAGSVRAMGLTVSVPIAFLCVWSFVPVVRGWFVMNALLVLLVAFLGMVVNAGVVGAVETPRPPTPTDSKEAGAQTEDGTGALGAGGMFLAPALFLATAAGALGWWRGHTAEVVLAGVIFLVPALGLIVLGVTQNARYRRPRPT